MVQFSDLVTEYSPKMHNFLLQISATTPDKLIKGILAILCVTYKLRDVLCRSGIQGLPQRN